MNRSVCAALAALLLAAQVAWASDGVGIYAVVDKVVLEPKDGPAERIQVWGAFALAKGDSGNDYHVPARGYLFFSLVKDSEDVCRKEWADLAKIAGTGQCVAFGSRYKDNGKIRKVGVEPKTPDVYPLGFGMQRVGNDHPLSAQLRILPSPLEPNEGDLVPPGAITLRIRNSKGSGDSKVKYVFAIDDGSGNQEVSDPIAPGDKQTQWTPKMSLKGDAKYTWRVWTKDDGKEDKSLAVVTTFKTKG
jgi:hypothetical protein